MPLADTYAKTSYTGVLHYRQVFLSANIILTYAFSIVILGPFTGALVNRFGCRAVSFAGSLISACALVLSTFSPTITAFQLTYGLAGGETSFKKELTINASIIKCKF